jgi:phosphoribosylformylglycinamidine cyclo-ligase
MSSYADAGVDIEAGDRAVELMKGRLARASRPEVVGGLGGFAGLFRLDTSKYREPLLASSTDGVGTKLAIAQAMGKHDTVGIDLVGMVVDDLVVCGAEPLFLQDYVAVGRVVPERIAEIVGGIATGCEMAGCALVGGETAEHPGLMPDDHYDIAGTGVGVVEADAVLGPDRVRTGDVVVAMAPAACTATASRWCGTCLLGGSRMPLDGLRRRARRARSARSCSCPTRIYAKDCLAVIAETACTRSRTSPAAASPPTSPGCCRSTCPRRWTAPTWTPAPVFGLVQGRGRVEQAEMERTFNMGVGMVAVLPAGRRRPDAGAAHRAARPALGGRRGRRGRRHRDAHRLAPGLTGRAQREAASSSSSSTVSAYGSTNSSSSSAVVGAGGA